MNGVKKSFSVPVLELNGKIAVSNKEKAELLAVTLIKVNSSENLSEEMKSNKLDLLDGNPEVTTRREVSNQDLDMPFSMYELEKAINNAKQSTPGKDGVCYVMLKDFKYSSLTVILKLFNLIWMTGRIPVEWKQSVIIPILKPGKNATDPSNYRPIALTSQLGKIMEKIVTDRLYYFIESKNKFCPFQSGFRKGRNTMDAVLCLESEVRKAQANKELVIAVFFDIEKAYDMLWKEGLLIKLGKIGIGGKIYNWILDFLFGREIEVRVGVNFSSRYAVENGTPQGSVCSPILFNIMINDIFDEIDSSIGKSLFADDGALWIRGHNLVYLQKKMQAAILKVEGWANKWGFRMSIAKTQVICFYRRHKEVKLNLYKHKLEQVKTVKFLGVIFDESLTWTHQIESVQNKCKKVNNLLRCLSGQEWGASRSALLGVYQALMRSIMDYGCIAYMAAADSHLRKLDSEQTQALRICCGAFRTSSLAALQVETGELPLRLRRLKLMYMYWVNLQGHKCDHPTKMVLKECWEHHKLNCNSFGWIGEIKAKQLGLNMLQYSATVPQSEIPPWLFLTPEVDLQLNEILKKGKTPEWVVVNRYFERYKDNIIIYTDGSKDPNSGRTGAAVNIPHHKVLIKRRTADHLAVFTVELSAIILALEWLLGNDNREVSTFIIASDSQAALLSIKSGKSSRLDLILRIYQLLVHLHNNKCLVQFVWIPAHVGIEGNEEVDILAKQALKSDIVHLNIPLSKNEGKSIIQKEIIKIWQELWDNHDNGRQLYTIQKSVGDSNYMSGRRKEEVVMSRLRIGHSGLNSSLFKIGKHENGACNYCNQVETVEHVLLECDKYSEERQILKSLLSRKNIGLSMISLLDNKSSYVRNLLFRFLNNTGLMSRI
uniref:Reverse transcriptase domain-containing protein n=1 Tax=Xiphophorus maculatus TaxID=8083 RepID=A0A3B5R9A6_XIPMA